MAPRASVPALDGHDWPAEIVAELSANVTNGRVGSTLVSATERVRVWHLLIAPGERLPFHRHVNDYFWTALTPSQAKSRFEDGSVRHVSYRHGDTRHYCFAAGDSMLHDLENIGETDPMFVTAELLGGANTPLAV